MLALIHAELVLHDHFMPEAVLFIEDGIISGFGEMRTTPIPDGCENLSGVTRATLKIRYKDLVTATVTTSRIEYENAPEGKTVTVLTSDLPVTLRGTSADVNAVTPEDVILLADLRDVSSASGSYTVPVEVRVDTNGDVGVVGTYQIRITISDIVEDEEPGIGDENDTDSNG